MGKRSPALGILGTKFFAWVQLNHLQIIHIGELQRPLALSATAEAELFKRLARQGYILRLKRGVYLVPDKIPAGGHWQPNDYYLVAQLMKVYHANYYVGGLSAFHHHGFVQQIPNEIVVYNDKISGAKQPGRLRVVCIKTAKRRIQGIEKFKMPDKTVISIASLARTLMDAVYDWSRYNSIPQAYEWIATQKNNPATLEELVRLTIHYSNKNTIRRIGYILDLLDTSTKLRNKLLQQLSPIKSWVPLDPKAPAIGTQNKIWRIIDNVN